MSISYIDPHFSDIGCHLRIVIAVVTSIFGCYFSVIMLSVLPRCWSVNPVERPSMSEIVRVMSRLSKVSFNFLISVVEVCTCGVVMNDATPYDVLNSQVLM